MRYKTYLDLVELIQFGALAFLSPRKCLHYRFAQIEFITVLLSTKATLGGLIHPSSGFISYKRVRTLLYPHLSLLLLSRCLAFALPSAA